MGPLAAAARVAVEEHFPLLAHTHDLTSWLEAQLESLGVTITQRAETNMLFIDTRPLGFTCRELNARLKSLSRPILSWAPRIVMHHQIAPEAVREIVQVVAAMKQEVQESGKFAEGAGVQTRKRPYGK